jgi:hypothetical protein
VTVGGVMGRLVFGAVIALVIWPFFGLLGLLGVVPFLVLCGVIAVGLFGRSKPPENDVTGLNL